MSGYVMEMGHVIVTTVNTAVTAVLILYLFITHVTNNWLRTSLIHIHHKQLTLHISNTHAKMSRVIMSRVTAIFVLKPSFMLYTMNWMSTMNSCRNCSMSEDWSRKVSSAFIRYSLHICLLHSKKFTSAMLGTLSQLFLYVYNWDIKAQFRTPLKWLSQLNNYNHHLINNAMHCIPLENNRKQLKTALATRASVVTYPCSQ